MAVNLATKYEKRFAEMYAQGNYLEGKYSTAWNFDGANEIAVQSPVTVPLTPYQRTGMARYGETTEMDTVLQKMKLTQELGFSKALDRGNYSDSQMAISAKNWMDEEVKRVVRPTVEKYAIQKWVEGAGGYVGVSAKPTKIDVIESVLTLDELLDDGNVSDTGRHLILATDVAKQVALSSEFMSLEQLGVKAIGRGNIGQIGQMQVTKVPKSWMPEGCFGFVVQKDAAILAKKLTDMHLHTDPVGIRGWVMEGAIYFDAFVLGAKANGVAALVQSSARQATPAIAISDNKATITSSGASRIMYTVDGSDPRYSASAQVYTAAVTIPAGGVVKAVAYKNGGFASDVAEK